MAKLTEKSLRGMKLFRVRALCKGIGLEFRSRSTEDMISDLLESHPDFIGPRPEKSKAPKKTKNLSSPKPEEDKPKVGKKGGKKKGGPRVVDSDQVEVPPDHAIIVSIVDKVTDRVNNLEKMFAEFSKSMGDKVLAIEKEIELSDEAECDDRSSGDSEDEDNSEDEDKDDNEDDDPDEVDDQFKAAQETLSAHIEDGELNISENGIRQLKRPQLLALAIILELDEKSLPKPLPKLRNFLVEKYKEEEDDNDDEGGVIEGPDGEKAEVISESDGLDKDFWTGKNKKREFWVCLGDMENGNNDWVKGVFKKIEKDEESDLMLGAHCADHDSYWYLACFDKQSATVTDPEAADHGDIYPWCAGFVVE